MTSIARISILLMAVCHSVVLHADEHTDSSDGAGPESIPVNTFDPSIDISHVQSAIASRDAAQMADSAIMLWESERILLRSHPQVKFGEVFELAVRMAVVSADMETLQRLQAFTEQHELKDLTASITTQQKLAASSRSDSEPANIAIQGITVLQFSEIQNLRSRIRHYLLISDRRSLTSLNAEIEAMNLPDDLKSILLREISAAMEQIPLDHPAPSAFLKMAGESRGFGINDFKKAASELDRKRVKISETVVHGGRYTVTLKNPGKTPIVFHINGRLQIALLGGKQQTYTGTGTATILFSTGSQGGEREYKLNSGWSYVFRWKHHGALGWEPAGYSLDLYKDN
jgi:hypothetical protein